MPPIFRLDLLSTAGARFAQITAFHWLSCVTSVNAPGLLRAQLDGDHDALKDAAFVDKCGVELWWKDDDLALDWVRLFSGLYRAQNRAMSPSTFLLTAPGDRHRLGWRIVNWAANTANRSKFTTAKGETVMKTLVDTNAGANATVVNGRKRTGTITGLSIEADGAQGNTVDWYCHGANLLKTLQDLAQIAGGDFDLVKTGAAAWEFRWGCWHMKSTNPNVFEAATDRTATIKFSYENGNLDVPDYEYNRMEEATVACVWGQGQDADRDYVTRTGADYDAGNDIEVYVDAKDVEKGNTAGLNARGDKAANDARAREHLGYTIAQTPECHIGKHYFVGDLVTLRDPWTGVETTQKVMTHTLGVAQDGAVTHDVELGTP